jgi:hypothetical protein
VPYTAVSTLGGVHPTTCPHLLALRAEYADWNWYTEDGYIRYSLGMVRTTYEHRMVAERAFGEIPTGYHVHHVDNNRGNNSAANLEVLSPGEHARIHKYTLRVRMVCPGCGKEVDMPPALASKRQHCSQKCREKAQPSRRPEREVLWRQMHDVNNWTTLGRMYGVSDNAVRKWARRYGLDLSVCDGRRKGGDE